MKTRMFRIVTGIAAAYHIFLAAVCLLCPVDTVVKLVDIAFGVALQANPQFALISKFTSVYMLVFGVMLLVLSSEPTRYRALAIPALVLFWLRFANRIIFFLFNYSSEQRSTSYVSRSLHLAWHPDRHACL